MVFSILTSLKGENRESSLSDRNLERQTTSPSAPVDGGSPLDTLTFVHVVCSKIPFKMGFKTYMRKVLRFTL